MRQRGSQIRDVLLESGMCIWRRLNRREVLLRDEEADGLVLELWIENDFFAGYVIEIDGNGYEFVRDVRYGEKAGKGNL